MAKWLDCWNCDRPGIKLVDGKIHGCIYCNPLDILKG